MNEFTPILVTVQELLNGDKVDSDRRNYFVPRYQRPYAWKPEHAKKLLLDIKEASEMKVGNTFRPYFIGGIVLSKESMEGEERTRQSLEIIDGQQRLTTLILLLAVIVRQLKSTDRSFAEEPSFIKNLTEDIMKLIYPKTMDYETRNYRNQVKVERSDELKELYESTLIVLMNNPQKSIEKYFDEQNITDGFPTNFRDVVIAMNITLREVDDSDFVDLIYQLLRHTYIVTTLTLNIDTGFLVFEKLNDSGIDLEPQDLLKNLLFRTSNERQYGQLTEQWKLFLNEVELVNGKKSKMLPREFLENYLMIIGKSIDSSQNKRSQVFQLFKTLRKESFDDSIALLLDLKDTAIVLKSLKEDSLISSHLNPLNFKLGYLIFLSYYKKFPDEYIGKKDEILIICLRLSLAYFLSSNSKILSEKIPAICKKIYLSDTNIETNLNNTVIYIDGLLENIAVDFENMIALSNLFRKKTLTRMLLNIINFSLDGNKLTNNYVLTQIMPQTVKSTDGSYRDINTENISIYANMIGNLTILPYDLDNDIEELFFEQRKIVIANASPIILNISPLIQQDLNEISQNITLCKYENWSKEAIEKRSQAMTKIALDLIINGKLSSKFISYSHPKYYIKRKENKDAVMIIKDDLYCVLKGSKCNKDHHETWGYNNLKKELLENRVLVDRGDFLEFTSDYGFKSPSAAASIVLGKQSPGPLDWRDINGKPLKEIED